MVEVQIEEEKCTGCGTCVDVCPVTVLELRDKGDRKVSVVVNNDACIVCRACEVQCEGQCLKIIE